MKKSVMKVMLLAMVAISASNAFAESHPCTATEIEVLKHNKDVLEERYLAPLLSRRADANIVDTFDGVGEGLNVQQQIRAAERMIESGICSESGG
jgi:hypothetical protein